MASQQQRRTKSNRTRTRAEAARRESRTFHPAVEPLESRCVLSGIALVVIDSAPTLVRTDIDSDCCGSSSSMRFIVERSSMPRTLSESTWPLLNLNGAIARRDVPPSVGHAPPGGEGEGPESPQVSLYVEVLDRLTQLNARTTPSNNATGSLSATPPGSNPTSTPALATPETIGSINATRAVNTPAGLGSSPNLSSNPANAGIPSSGLSSVPANSPGPNNAPSESLGSNTSPSRSSNATSSFSPRSSLDSAAVVATSLTPFAAQNAADESAWGNHGSYANSSGSFAKGDGNRTTLLVSRSQPDDASPADDATQRSDERGDDDAASGSQNVATTKRTTTTARAGTRALRGAEAQRTARRAAGRNAAWANEVEYRDASRAVVLDNAATDAAFNTDDFSPEGGVIELISNSTAHEPWAAARRAYDRQTQQQATRAIKQDALEQTVTSYQAVEVANDGSETAEAE